MTETPPATPPAVPSAPGEGGAGPYKVFQTEQQYQAALNRKLANYVPKTELDIALQRATALEASIATLQTENQAIKNKLSGYEIGDLRQKVGKDAGLPADWIEDIKGTDEASLKADAERLRKKLGIKHNAGNPVPPLTPGTPATENDEMNAALRALAGMGETSGR
ncbi:MAG: hypothetical protein WC343_03855 [Bacilli bacterium]|jgi:hypothetical protein